MPKSREDFLPDVGSFLDGAEGDIIDATFEIASGKYADQVMVGGTNKQPPVQLVLTVDSPKFEKPATQGYSVGGQDVWEIIDGGKAIQNIKNPDKHTLRKGSLSGHLVEHMALAIGDGNMEKGQDLFMKRDHYMTEAAFYTGLSFLFKATPIDYEIDGRKFTTTPPLPAKFLGETGGTAKAKPTAKSAPTASNEALDTILADNAAGKTDRELKTFAVRNPDIKADDDYMKAVVSGKKLKELEDAGVLTMDPGSKTYL